MIVTAIQCVLQLTGCSEPHGPMPRRIRMKIVVGPSAANLEWIEWVRQHLIEVDISINLVSGPNPVVECLPRSLAGFAIEDPALVRSDSAADKTDSTSMSSSHQLLHCVNQLISRPYHRRPNAVGQSSRVSEVPHANVIDALKHDDGVHTRLELRSVKQH